MDNSERSYLSQKLTEFRKYNEFRQHEVAELLGLTRSSYSYYESGKTTPSPEKLNMLAKIYGVNIEDFFEPEKESSVMYDAKLNTSPEDEPADMTDLSSEERMLIARFRLAKAKDRKKAVTLLERSINEKKS